MGLLWPVSNCVIQNTKTIVVFTKKKTLHKICQKSFTGGINIQTVVIIPSMFILGRRIYILVMQQFPVFQHHTLKRTSRHDDAFFVTGFTEGCHDDKPDSVNDERSSTWRPFRFNACRNFITLMNGVSDVLWGTGRINYIWLSKTNLT